MSELFRSISLQLKAEKAQGRERSETKIEALQELRWELCRIFDDLITHEEQTLNQEASEYEDS